MIKIQNKDMKLNSKTEVDFFKQYYSLDDKNPKDKYLKDKMLIEIYEFYRNMFINKFKKSFLTSYDMQDYESNYKIEFFKAINNFDISKGFRFSTYLFTKINKSIQKTNKEESLFSIKEYKLNILHIFKSKILEEINKINNIYDHEKIENTNLNDIKGTKDLNLEKIYNDMYKKYSLPKIKFESLIKDLPYVFSQRIGNEYNNDSGPSGDSGDKIDNLLHECGGDFNNYNNINIFLDLYFEIEKIYKNNKGKNVNIFLELIKKGFKLECTNKDIEEFYKEIKKGGEDASHFIEDNLNKSDTFLINLAKKNNLIIK